MGDGTTARNVIFAVITIVLLIIIISSQLPLLPKIAKSILGFDPLADFYNSTDDRIVTPTNNLENLKIKQEQILRPFIEDYKACKLSKDVDCFCDIRNIKLTEEEIIVLESVKTGTRISIYEGRIEEDIRGKIEDLVRYQRNLLVSDIIPSDEIYFSNGKSGFAHFVASEGFYPKEFHVLDPQIVLIKRNGKLIAFSSVFSYPMRSKFYISKIYKANQQMMVLDRAAEIGPDSSSMGRFREKNKLNPIGICDPKKTTGPEGKPALRPTKEQTPIDILLEDTRTPEKEKRSREAQEKLSEELKVLDNYP